MKKIIETLEEINTKLVFSIYEGRSNRLVLTLTVEDVQAITDRLQAVIDKLKKVQR